MSMGGGAGRGGGQGRRPRVWAGQGPGKAGRGEPMRNVRNWLAGLAGVGCGLATAAILSGPPRPALASSNDRYQDYVMCTGAVTVNPKVPTDGVWMLDYRRGKLAGTVIDRTTGKISGWAEVDLVTEFGIAPKQDVHFMMTTGTISQGQAALYVCEVSTGKFGVYTMGSGDSGGIQVRRHDMTTFRSGKPTPVTTAGGREQTSGSGTRTEDRGHRTDVLSVLCLLFSVLLFRRGSRRRGGEAAGELRFLPGRRVWVDHPPGGRLVQLLRAGDKFRIHLVRVPGLHGRQEL